MDWLRTLPGVVFWWGWGMVALLAAGSLYATWWARRNAKVIGAQTPRDVSDLSEGLHLAWGRTVGPELAAPLTRRPCVWWKAEVWESVREADASGKYRHVWRQIAQEESDRPLLFGDDRTWAAVWANGATVMSSEWSDWRGQNFPPEDRSPPLNASGAPGGGIRHDVQGTFGPRFRYVEQTIGIDVPFFALGEVTRSDPALYQPDDEDDDDADPDAGFGDDGGSGDLWRPEPSRLGQFPTPDDVIAADMSRATWSVTAARGKPFLLSTDHPDAISAEQELGAKGGLIMGGLFAATAMLLLWLRYAS
ncbi:hypothetical protein ACRDNQ_08245 [Palleronia sp. KMU-117]|uniref:hypothetical protein n=1 Tax=Palleronia sp. KMU-117 TaxID=3434108 RepID=UPI003D755510